MNYDVIGIGNALVDIQINISDNSLEKLNLTKGGMTLSSPEEQEKILNSLKEHSPNICSGGSAANTMHGITCLGGSAYYFGRVANDEYGRLYTKDMSGCGLGFPGPSDETIGTGTSIVLITPDAQRTMVTDLGISAKLHPDNVDDSIVEGARFVYIEGYLWCNENTREAAIKLAGIAKNHGIPIAFTLSDAFVINSFRDSISEFIKNDVNILFCNEVEGQSLAREEDPEKAFDNIIGMCNHLFFTCAEKGVLAAGKGEDRISVRGFNVNAIDSTGAGDLFAAGALQGLIHGKTTKECSILGCYCASQVITRIGARLPNKSIKKIDDIIYDYDKDLE